MKLTRQLQDEWAKKLADSGFEDIEDSTGRLKNWTLPSDGRNHHFTADMFAQRQDFYICASHLLHDHHFESEQDRRIWECVCDGMPVREINRTLQVSRYHIDKLIAAMKPLIIYAGIDNDSDT